LIEEGELQSREILFPNASREGSGGELKPGDTLSLGRFPAGTRIGFFLIADGAADPRETYYTLDALNPGDQRHLAMLALPDREHVILGMEDLPAASGDRDFNDLLFTLTTEPKSALSEAIEDSQIPVASSPPAPVPEASPPPASQEPNHVMLQESKGPPMIEGSGVGCQVGGNGRLEGASSLLLGVILIWLFRHFSMHSRDIIEIFRMPKRRPFRFRLHENLAPKCVLPSKWLNRPIEAASR
ncbi:MAG TPA: DUF4114 domain-containing protein, partial [bacterium]|nr:DUF4114 domain-containing protein [bacterium]